VAGRGAKRGRRIAAATVLLGGLLYAREVETRWVEVRPVELTLPQLAPEFAGCRLVQMGDIHLDDWSKPERLHRIVDRVDEQHPDLVVIAGDFARYSAKEFDGEQLHRGAAWSIAVCSDIGPPLLPSSGGSV
jgi:predicted MPP superfamily phosphohydrolase